MRDCLNNLPVTTVSFTPSGNINLQLDSSSPISRFLRPDLTTFAPCAICLDIYELNDLVRLLPCHHFFHKKCIDTWLNRANNCPTCRGDVRSRYRDLVYMAAAQGSPNSQNPEISNSQDLTYVSELNNLSLSDSEQLQVSPRQRAAASANTAGSQGYPTDPARRHAVQAAERRRNNPLYYL
ncbi:hypothetical protein TSMEX_010318 [Taenia solium]|eukprot:TsM_000284800 transcript=TsM_000284800 gene=TsM_000284800